MTIQPRKLAALAAVLPAVCAASLAESAAAATPTATAAKTCTPPKYPGSGYFTSLSVSRVSCKTGARVARAHYACRMKKGRAGKCTARVLRFRCKETRKTSSIEINAKVTCRKGSAKVIFTYQQNLD